MPKRIKASEIVVTKALTTAISRQLAPMDAWETIDAPDVYLESKTGKYLRGLELVLEKAVELNDLSMVRTVLLDLLKMTKMGRPKADVNVSGLTKLRDETDLSKIDTEQLRQILGRGGVGSIGVTEEE